MKRVNKKRDRILIITIQKDKEPDKKDSIRFKLYMLIQR